MVRRLIVALTLLAGLAPYLVGVAEAKTVKPPPAPTPTSGWTTIHLNDGALD